MITDIRGEIISELRKTRALVEKERVAKEDLRELVEEWRDKADSAPHDMCVEKMYDYAADDLEEVLEQ